jgi:tripartite-type tricarboxylate transporter receptor subunit TctC
MRFPSVKTVFLSLLIIIFFSLHVKAAQDFPNKPIEMIVGFGKGGSTDTLARVMAPFLADVLHVPIKIHNIPGRGSATAIEAFLKKKSDGYTILCSAFSPYLPAAILRKDTSFSMKDLDFLNIQSYGFDIVAVNAKSDIKSLSQFLRFIKEKTEKLNIAVVENSSGYLLLRMMFEKMNIPINNVNIYRYNSGGEARKAIANGTMDAIVISSKRTEFIRKFITPLAIYAKERQLEWDVPTVNEALIPLRIQVPYVPVYMRGFAVHPSLKKNYPKRYQKLYDAFVLLMAKKSVQRYLKKNKVGGAWTGSQKSTQSLHDSYAIFHKYSYLLDR